MSDVTSSRVRVKICGITHEEDAIAAIDAGADAIGLVFYERSSRNVTIAQAQQLCAHLPPFVQITGLFVNADLETIRDTTLQVGLDVIQLHGEESPTFCRMLPGRIIKAIRVAQSEDLHQASAYDVSAILYDAKVSGMQGGSGRTFDWSLLANHPGHRPMILAGGLHPGNVAQAIAQVHPYAVDVSSGVESSPGVKDPVLIREFMHQVHQARQHHSKL
ncbi:MAG: phosphoribosylanthranilate isomerase [Magnetococcales bacterium]|nr:phosphoribosylanthranilate isomerase [Magnetococcales bacterium]